MSPEQDANGWVEYRRMVVDWHEQDVEDRKQIRRELTDHLKTETAYQVEVREALTQINLTLAALKTERKIAKALGGYVIPAAIAAIVAWVTKAATAAAGR